MYDYATQQKQNQIITEIGEVNTNIENLNSNIENLITIAGVIEVIICLILISELIMRCLGDKRR